MVDCLAGRVEPDMARLGHGASVQRQLVQTAELERTVAQLERQQAQRGRA